MTDRTPTQILANGAIRYGEYDSDGAFVQHRYLVLDDEPTAVGTSLCSGNLFSQQTQNTFPDGCETVNHALATLMDAHNKLSQPGQLVQVLNQTKLTLSSSGTTLTLATDFDTYRSYIFRVISATQTGSSSRYFDGYVDGTQVFVFSMSGSSATEYSGFCNLEQIDDGYLVTRLEPSTYTSRSPRSASATSLASDQITLVASGTMTVDLVVYAVANQATTYVPDDSDVLEEISNGTY